MGCSRVCGEEFQIKKLGFSGVESDLFYTFLWRPPPIVYLLYRFVVAAYTLTWLIYTALNTSTSTNAPYAWPVYLTNWSYTVLTLYMVSHFLTTLLYFCVNCGRCEHGDGTMSLISRTDKEKHQECIRGMETDLQNTLPYQSIPEDPTQTSAVRPTSLPMHLMFVWILFDITSLAALMVTCIFWTTIYPDLPHGESLSTDDIQLHIINTVIILIEHSLTAIPFRLLHIIYPFAYALIYCIFSAIFWGVDHKRVIYPILDWNKSGETVGIVLLIGFVIVPLLHTLFFLIYKLKLFIYQRICS